MTFKDKVVLITGASSDIGAVVAMAFNAQGARVVLVGLDQSTLEAVAAGCNRSLSFCVDITNDKEARRIIDQTIQKYGQLDVLVNSVVQCTFSMTDSILAGDMLHAYDQIMGLNVRAIVHLTTLAAPHLLKTKGNIINISNVAGLRSPSAPSWINYSLSKAALKRFTTCAAAELGAFGVRVNTLSPGPVRTQFIYSANCLKPTVLHIIAEPEGISELILFLASDKARLITGSNYVSDNGVLVKGA